MIEGTLDRFLILDYDRVKTLLHLVFKVRETGPDESFDMGTSPLILHKG